MTEAVIVDGMNTIHLVVVVVVEVVVVVVEVVAAGPLCRY